MTVTAMIGLVVGGSFLRHADNVSDAQDDWESRTVVTIEDFGTVSQVTITALSGPLANDDRLLTEPGLSLLIEADSHTLLFDYGLNAHPNRRTVPNNAKVIGADLSRVNIVFLSHRHRDHMGGKLAESSGKMDLDSIGVSPTSVAVFAPPDALSMPGWAVSEIYAPSIIGNGAASLGPIRRALFVGPIEEQALVLDIEGYGLVLVVGCGHQTLEKLSARMEEVFGRQPRAIVGDLHYPVPNGRLQIAGIDAQRRLASGDGPLQPVGDPDVSAFSQYVLDHGTELYLVGHDTHDDVLALPFVHSLSVGRSITLGNTR